MNKKLLLEAIFKYFLGLLLVALLLFIPSASFHYWNAWLFIFILFIPMFIAGIIIYFKNPKLLARRLNVKEKENEQKEVIAFSGIMFIASFITAGLNYRYKWSNIPIYIVIIATIIFLIAYILYAIVLKENEYLLRTIEVEKDQKLIDNGLYKIVRHPMYSVTLLLFLMIPLILGSIVSFIIMLIYPIIIIKRIDNEEYILEKQLKGYREYKNKVKYKLIPFIW